MAKNSTFTKIAKINYKFNQIVKNDFVTIVLILCYIDRFVDFIYFGSKKIQFSKNDVFTKLIELLDAKNQNKKVVEENKEKLIKVFVDFLAGVYDEHGWLEIIPGGRGEYACRNFSKIPVSYFVEVLDVLRKDGNPFKTSNDYKELLSLVSKNSINEKKGDENNGVSHLINRLAIGGKYKTSLNIGIGNGLAYIQNAISVKDYFLEPETDCLQRFNIASTLVGKNKLFISYDNEELIDDIGDYDVVTLNRPLNTYEKQIIYNASKGDGFGDLIIHQQDLVHLDDDIRILPNIVNNRTKKEVLLIPNSILSDKKLSYNLVRKELINEKCVKSIIQLPEGIFKYSLKKYSIVIIDNTKKNNSITMLDLSDKKMLSTEDIDNIVEYLEGKKKHKRLITIKTSSIDDGYILLPEQYLPKIEHKKNSYIVDNDEQAFEQLNEVREEINTIYKKLIGE